MKRETISLRRRALVIAGVTGAAAPAFAGLLPQSAAGPAAPRAGDAALVSGRVVGLDGRPLAHVAVVLADGGERTLTDGDGRFMMETAAPRAGRLDYRIEQRRHRVATHSGWQKDDNGVWRTTVSLTAA